MLGSLDVHGPVEAELVKIETEDAVVAGGRQEQGSLVHCDFVGQELKELNVDGPIVNRHMSVEVIDDLETIDEPYT